jgi:hypothetical protein
MRTFALSFMVIFVGCGRGPEASTGSAALTAEEAAAVCAADQARACDPAQTHKLTICHIPPGNPENAHTLCVGSPSLEAHLAHGDAQGPCACPQAGDPAPTEPAPTPTDPAPVGDPPAPPTGGGDSTGTIQ